VEAMERSRTVRLGDSYLSLGYATGAMKALSVAGRRPGPWWE
jgi:hypothetical protein